MGLDDIPSQVARVLKYSTRSFRSFLLSLTVAIFVIGFSVDLIYGFFYVRLTGDEHVKYNRAFWIVFLAIALSAPIIAGLVAYIKAWRLTRPFNLQKYGVAIAPFQIFSLDPDVLGTPSKMQALEGVMDQFFNASRHLLMEKPWFEYFEFRFLPPSSRVLTERDAQERGTKLRAKILIWGSVIQEIQKPLHFVLNISAQGTNLQMSGKFNPLNYLYGFQFYLLSATAYALWKQREYQRAGELFNFAAEPADKLDNSSEETKKSKYHRAMIHRWMVEMNAESSQRA